MKTRAHLLWVVLVGALLMGCTDRPTAGDPPEETPTPTISSSPEPVVDWKTVRTWKRGGALGNGVHNGLYTAVFDAHDTDSEAAQRTRVEDASGKVVLRRSSEGSGWYTQNIWLSGHFAVIEDLNNDEREVRLFVYDLRTGKLVDLPRGLVATQPEMDAAFGRLAFTTGTAESGMCQQVVDLATMRAEPQAPCQDRGFVLADAALGVDAQVFSRVLRPNEQNRCKEILVQRAAEVTTVPLQERCGGWSAAVLPTAVAWDEMNPFKQPNMSFAQGYILPAGGEMVSLGEISTDTLVACGNRFFWTVEDGRGARVDSWSPSGIETVWQPDANVLPTTLVCADGRWLNTRMDDISGKNETSKLVTLDTSGL